jgi:hypothetical protein
MEKLSAERTDEVERGRHTTPHPSRLDAATPSHPRRRLPGSGVIARGFGPVAIQFCLAFIIPDCFVVPLLAMTFKEYRRGNPGL